MSAKGAPTRRGFALALLVLFTLACLAWVLMQVDGPRMVRELVAFDPVVLFVALGAFYGTLLLRTWRFGLLLDADVGWMPLLSAVSIGSLAMSVMPLRLGEFVRPYLLLDRHDVPLARSVAAVVVERVLDLLALLVLMVVVARTVEVRQTVTVMGVDVLSAGLMAAQTTAGIGIVGIAALVVLGERLLWPLRRVLQPVAPSLYASVERQWEGFVAAMRQAATTPARLVAGLVSTTAVWVVTVGMVRVALVGVDGLTADWPTATAAWAAMTTAMVLFPAPGFLGGFEAAAVAALRALGEDATGAGVFAVAVHVLMLGGYALVGGLFSLREGVSFFSVVRASQTLGTDGTPPA